MQVNGNLNENQKKAQLYKEEGNEAFLKSDYTLAVKLYGTAIALDPQNPIYFNNRSQAYFYLDNFEEALQDCNKSLSLNPSYLKALNNKAQVLQELGDIEQATQLLQHIQQYQPNEVSQQMLKKIMSEQSKFQTLSVDDPEYIKHQKLINWLLIGCTKFPKLKLQYYSKDYRGVHTIRKVYAKEVVLFVPQTHLITLEMAKETQVSKKILQNKLDLLSPKHSHLSTFLLQEKMKPESFWRPYLDILPVTYSAFPIFYNESDMSQLQGSPFLKQINEKLQDLKKDYQDICGVAPQFAQYGFEEFCWARMTASSRIFGITINGIKTDAFVPLADMLNHRRPKQTSWMYSDEREGFLIETDEDIERGQMVFDSYGRKCNSRFLLNYGFIVEENDANEVAITIQIDRRDPLFQMKEEMIQDTIPDIKIFRILEDTEEANVQEFQAYIRFLVISETKQLALLQNIQYNQQNLHDRSGGYRPQKTPPITIELETAMWKKISELCNSQITQYPTSLKEDLQLLKNTNLTQNLRNCLLLRSGEKQILSFYIDMADKMIKILNNTNKKELVRFMHKQSNMKFLNYVNKVVLPFLAKQENQLQ